MVNRRSNVVSIPDVHKATQGIESGVKQVCDRWDLPIAHVIQYQVEYSISVIVRVMQYCCVCNTVSSVPFRDLSCAFFLLRLCSILQLGNVVIRIKVMLSKNS